MVTRKQTEQAAKELAKKLKREAKVTPHIKGLFSRITKAVRAQYEANGTFYDVKHFESAWKSLLEDHYRKTGADFAGEVLDIQPATSLKAVVDAAYLKFSNSRAIDSAQEITKTNRKDVRDAYRAAEKAIRELEEVPRGHQKNVAVAKLGTRNLKETFSARTPRIAETETQVSSEGYKSLEARALGGEELIPDQPDVVDKSSRIIKTWITVGDSKVREAHALATGQRVVEPEPFIVNGEKLRYPGDSTLGASLGNIIRCRCTALYEAEDK